MGYYSSLRGSFEIIPAPASSKYNVKKLKDAEEKERRWGLECVTVEFLKEISTEIEEDGAEVTRARVTAAQISACNESDHKHYHVVETLQAIVDMLGRDRQYKGYFESHGEDGEQWRYGIVDGVAAEFKPVISWPEQVS